MTSSSSALSIDWNNAVYDGGTICPDWPAVPTHCCPDGMAMIGVHVNRNVFKCAPVIGGLTDVQWNGTAFFHNETIRNGMHACPFGWLMVGFHNQLNLLKCARPAAQSVQLEAVDSSSNDGFPMHVCPEKSSFGYYDSPYRYAMSGIHVNQNKLTCAR